jgi:hypothetical protein
MDATDKRAGSLALMAISVVMALACVSAIGTVTTLVVMTLDITEPAPVVATYDAECEVVALKSGITHCLRNIFDAANMPVRRDAAVVIQAQADPAR